MIMIKYDSFVRSRIKSVAEPFFLSSSPLLHAQNLECAHANQPGHSKPSFGGASSSRVDSRQLVHHPLIICPKTKFLAIVSLKRRGHYGSIPSPGVLFNRKARR